jgi:putative restriction endonuclease
MAITLLRVPRRRRDPHHTACALPPRSRCSATLLRADIHRLFDAGYVTVTPERRFVVSRRLAEEFENGRAYYAMEGRDIALPVRVTDQPDPGLLRWHNENVFERTAA